MKQQFLDKGMSQVNLDTIAIINAILDEYRADGYVLTLRQLYYQLVARGNIENSIKSYKRIVDLVTNGRLMGLIDWSMITDRGRVAQANSHWENPAEIMRACANQFMIDKWADQPVSIVVEVEKDALSGILAPVCRELDVTFIANRGYSSISSMYETGRRLRRMALSGKDVYVLYLGDHDPSGIDMTRDVEDRLSMFAEWPVRVQRLALNYDQVEALHPPENPAKESDSRFAAYQQQFGESSWELDAVEPRALAELVSIAVNGLRDDALWTEALEREDSMRQQIKRYADMSEHEEANDDNER